LLKEGQILNPMAMLVEGGRKERKMSDLSEGTAEDGDFCEYMDVSPVHDATASPPEMRCPICLEVRHDFAGDFDHKQRWIFLQCCEEAVCRQCLRQHLQSNGTRCPLTPAHRMMAMDVIAGCSGQEEWLKLEQRTRFQDAGGRGFCCSQQMCAALLPPPPSIAPWDRQPFPSPCPGCFTAHCGRCGSPWPNGNVMERHVCEDLRHATEERAVQSRVAAEKLVAPMIDALASAVSNETDFDWVSSALETLHSESARRRLNGVGLEERTTDRLMGSFPARANLPGASPEMRLSHLLQERRAQQERRAGEHLPGEEDDDWHWHRLMDHERMVRGRRGRHTRTMQELEELNVQRRQNGSGPIKSCPTCGHYTERIDGCNIMSCTVCGADWCFICSAAKAESGCSHYHCRSAEAKQHPLSQSPGASSTDSTSVGSAGSSEPNTDATANRMPLPAVPRWAKR